MPKLCDMESVNGGEKEFPVELHRDDTGRLIVRAFNEGGFRCIDIDLLQLCEWLGFDDAEVEAAVSAREHHR